VPSELDDLFEQARRRIQRLDDALESPDYEEDAIELAVWVHARVIAIHPFEDGNGRTSRLLLNVLLVRLGLPPLAIDVPKEEYRRSLNHFYRTSDIGPLLDLAIRAADL
jgi:Fic family protein